MGYQECLAAIIHFIWRLVLGTVLTGIHSTLLEHVNIPLLSSKLVEKNMHHFAYIYICILLSIFVLNIHTLFYIFGAYIGLF